MKIILQASLIISLLFGFMVEAKEVKEFFIDPSQCLLMERGALGKENGIVIEGKKTEYGCVAFMQDKDFKERFEFCVYSGFEMAKAKEASYYSCDYTREQNSFMFRAYMSDEHLKVKPNLICKFMCYK